MCIHRKCLESDRRDHDDEDETSEKQQEALRIIEAEPGISRIQVSIGFYNLGRSYTRIWVTQFEEVAYRGGC